MKSINPRLGRTLVDRRRFVAGCLSSVAAVALPIPRLSVAHAAPAEWESKTVEVAGLRIHIVEHGTGPLVLLCHGFPETWHSWRHQIPVLAAAGYRVVAPDLRGYGGTSAPRDVGEYIMPKLVGDITGLMDALGEKTAVIVGHDFGAALAWHASLLAPNRFTGVAALSVPYHQRGPVPPTVAIKRAVGDTFHYMLYFQQPGVAERELEAALPKFLRAIYYTASADAAPRMSELFMRPRPTTMLDSLLEPTQLPSWLTEAEFQHTVDQFARTGLTGPLNWYRNIDANWERMKAFEGAVVKHPTLFMAGAMDPVLLGSRESVERLPVTVPGLRKKVLVPGCGHWIQQECPADVNRELLEFLQTLFPKNP
jgi:pimeloyl-ACP methyl ester carboxylesterase